ncbi:secreted RxLR effector protein 78-like [Glycine max]|uniref:secreted RxLR effector protein 78-like n=1 Tax=Glycine max TaxID=3847 RepID=UPI001B3552BF|nr:secreted RxLR effector protein 78-like [Glycine max]
MMNNIFPVQELLHKYARKRISSRCLLKIDLHKAYDSISWEFLDWMLKYVGFPAQFCSWIMECISTTSFSVAINGSIYGHFKGQRGLRQGDPLSPYLFFLCMQYFSHNLQSLKDNVNFQFHPNCAVVLLSHLAFADDIMLLSRGDLPSVSAIFSKL